MDIESRSSNAQKSTYTATWPLNRTRMLPQMPSSPAEIPSVSQSTGVLALLAAAASPLWMKSAIATTASCAPRNTVRTTSGACVTSFRVTEKRPLPKSNAVWEPA